MRRQIPCVHWIRRHPCHPENPGWSWCSRSLHYSRRQTSTFDIPPDSRLAPRRATPMPQSECCKSGQHQLAAPHAGTHPHLGGHTDMHRVCKLGCDLHGVQGAIPYQIVDAIHDVPPCNSCQRTGRLGPTAIRGLRMACCSSSAICHGCPLADVGWAGVARRSHSLPTRVRLRTQVRNP